MSAFKFKLGDRVVTPNGEIGTVIGNYLDAEGSRAGIELTTRATYPELDLKIADPESGAVVKSLQDDNAKLRSTLATASNASENLRSQLGQLTMENAELHRRLSRPKAKFAKKRR